MMPVYDYLCETNGRVIEVTHPMRELLVNWGELCERTGLAPGDTPVTAPVRKLISGGRVVRSENLGSDFASPCETAGPCGGMGCGLE